MPGEGGNAGAGAAADPTAAALASRADLAAALTALRQRRGLTIRELARRIDTPAGTVGDYLSGRHLPSTAQLPTFLALLSTCGVPAGEHDAWVSALGRIRSGSDRRRTRPPAPYRGLAAFEVADAPLYFGRAAETAALVDHVRRIRQRPGGRPRVIGVVGPSGSGKSSLLRAGVVASLQAKHPAGSGPGLRCVVATPTQLGTTGASAAAAGADVLIVDQCEEAFRAGDADFDRAAFFAALAALPSHVVVIAGLRADFYAAAAGEPLLLPALQHDQFLVGPMTVDNLRQAIERPATLAGCHLQDGFVELILADLGPRAQAGRTHDAGALPLLSHALLATWDRSDGTRITIADYVAAGGIRAAIEQTAESLYASLTPDEQLAARRIFLRLVHLGDGLAPTRRRASLEELGRIDVNGIDGGRSDRNGIDGGGIDGIALVRRFAEHRLVTTDTDSAVISHEALFETWPRLTAWIDADRAGLREHRRITEAANLWIDSGRDAQSLPRGIRLEAAVEWAGDPAHRTELAQVERDLLDAAVARDTGDRQLEQRRTRRLRRLLAMTAVLVLVVAGLAAYALAARAHAEHESALLRTARDDALSRQTAFQSDELAGTDPALSAQLALDAYRAEPTDAARGAVIDLSAHQTITRLLGRPGPTALAVSPAGNLIAVGDAADGSIHLYAPHPGRVPTAAGVIAGRGDAAQLFALAFTPDGRLLAAGGQGRTVQLWNVSTPATPTSVSTVGTSFTDSVQSVAISPSGRVLVAGGAGPQPVLRWDISTPTAPRVLPAPCAITDRTTVQSVAFSRDGTEFAAGGSDGAVFVWPTTDPQSARPRTAVAGTQSVNVVQFDVRGDLLFAGEAAGVVSVWGTGSGPAAHPPTHVMRRLHVLVGASDSPVDSLAVGGDQVAVGSADGVLRQWTIASWSVLTSTGHPGPVTGVAFSRDAATIMTTAADGALRLWTARPRAIPAAGSTFNLGYSADGARLLVAYNGSAGGIRLWDTRSPAGSRPLGPTLQLPAGVAPDDGTGAMSPDGDLVAGANQDGQVQLWNTTDAAHPQAVGPPFRTASALIEQLAFGPDGRLLAVADDDGTVGLWDVSTPATPRLVATLRGPGKMLNVAFSGDGRLLAAACADRRAELWDVADPAAPRRIAALGGFHDYVYGVAFNRAGSVLAATSADHTTRLWLVHGGARPRSLGPALVGPDDYVYSAAFSGDGRYLAVASNDRTVWLYDVHDPHHAHTMLTLRDVGQAVFAVAFSPDSRTLVAGGRSSTVAVWSMDTAAYVAQLCRTVGTPITRQEWSLYVQGSAYRPPCS